MHFCEPPMHCVSPLQLVFGFVLSTQAPERQRSDGSRAPVAPLQSASAAQDGAQCPSTQCSELLHAASFAPAPHVAVVDATHVPSGPHVKPSAHGVVASHFFTHALSTQMRSLPHSELYLQLHPTPVHAGVATQPPSTHSNPVAPQSVAIEQTSLPGSFVAVGEAQ